MLIKVIRAFLHKGEVQDVGSEVDVSNALAAELVYNGKAERLGAAPSAPGPMTTESASELISGGKRKAEK